MSEHGSLTKYKADKCRCDDCRGANRDYQAKRRLNKPPPGRKLELIQAGLPPGEFGPWRDKAACKGRTDINWFPDPPKGAEGGARSGDPVYRANVAAAKAVCAFCPVIRECLVNALDTAKAVDFGIRGGRTQGERDRIRRTRTRGTWSDAG